MSHESLLSQLDRDVAQGNLRALDVALARFLSERDIEAPATLLWLTALLSRQLADGNLCLDLATLGALADDDSWPEHWRAQLRTWRADPGVLDRSPLIARGTDGLPSAAPLVLDGHRLYLRRYWNHERSVASAIRQRLGSPLSEPASLRDELDRLFPDPAPHGPNWPKVACALATRCRFSVITGGPGTGKTTTVVRLLGLLQTLQLREHAQPLRIRLAAPTGKAAARLNASIATQVAQLDVDESVRSVIPATVETLHRLLGARPDTRRLRHNQANPLHLDVLVIDEASMIDLEMMSAVLSALPPDARLILLGDKDQLSSVEAGAVLGDLCRHAETAHYSEETAAWLQQTTGEIIQDFVGSDATALNQQVTMLRYSHRFADNSGIGRLARAVNQGNALQAVALLGEPSADLSRLSGDHAATVVDRIIDGNPHGFAAGGDNGHPHGYRHYLEQLQRLRPAPDAGSDAHDHWARELLIGFSRFQLLCALRQGPKGVEGWNATVAQALYARQLIESPLGWYEGRPVMITRNDYGLGLANGDVGLCLRMPDETGALRLVVSFLLNAAPGDDIRTRVRHVLPSRLGDVTTVYAMTVHKSQGSEFDHAALVLPDESAGVLSRELLYTGITRARRWFTLIGADRMVADAIDRPTQRRSGLGDNLDQP